MCALHLLIVIMEIYDVVIVGGGPCGLACGIEAKANNLSYLILEKGNITESIRRYPVSMTFFSTAEMLEIGRVPFVSLNMRPNRVEALKYYRRVVKHFDLNLQLFSEVTDISIAESKGFKVTSTKGEVYAKNVILATGYYDVPRKINVPGEDLPHVSHYFDEPFKYTNTKVVVVGGANSAIETALDLYRNGAEVTLVHQFSTLDKTAKYWIVPDMENRIKENAVHAIFDAKVTSISPEKVMVQKHGATEVQELEADFVFLMTGYRPDADFLRQIGVKLEGDALIPAIDKDTFETNVKGVYVAGSVVGGEETAKIFIENGRGHGKVIIDHIVKGRQLK